MFKRNKRVSIYEMQGNLQDAKIEEQRLILFAGRYHISVTHSHLKDLTKVIYPEDPNFINRTKKIYIPEKNSWYDFAVLSSNRTTVFVDVPTDATHGHSAIALGHPVILAGEIRFGENGTIELWNNKSGHYQVGSHHKEFTSGTRYNLNKDFCHSYLGMRIPNASKLNPIPILPINNFQLFEGD